mmetsp:Transcript_35716/g.43036  ORF Transcript_35716/g.43036 Transcript_35716/m.43036 type:complete len:102 (+) Transcript_35716:194-499(+)
MHFRKIRFFLKNRIVTKIIYRVFEKNQRQLNNNSALGNCCLGTNAHQSPPKQTQLITSAHACPFAAKSIARLLSSVLLSFSALFALNVFQSVCVDEEFLTG